MAIQYSTAVRNAQLDALETAIGVSAVLKIRTGAAPANVATADSGTVLATMTLPSDWLTTATSGSKAKNGTWQDSSANAAGTGGYFRIYDSAGSACHIQGTVAATSEQGQPIPGGGGGDLTLDNTNIAAAQNVTINTFSITAANA